MKTKKVISILSLIIVIVTICTPILTVSTCAASTSKSQVKAFSVGQYKIAAKEGLTIRSNAGTNHKKLGAIPYNTLVNVTAVKNNNWGYVKYGKVTGYICLDYTKYVTPNNQTFKIGEYKISEKAGVNIRLNPGANYKKVGAIPYNTVVKVTSVKNNWGYVKYGNVCGWICLDYAKTTSSKTETPTSNTQKINKTIKFVNSLSSKYKTNITTQKWGAYYKGNGYHLGTDLATRGNKSTTVGAIAEGIVYRVVKESKSGGYGNFVIVKHTLPNGKIFYSGYAHLKSISVKENARVSAGTKLGMMGSTGYSTGPHLHLVVFNGPFSKSSLPKGYISKKITGDSIKIGSLTYYNPLKVISSKGTTIK